MRGMILAAGLGTRLRPVTETIPKPAIPFMNVPLFYYSLEHFRQAGIDSLVINTHYLPDKMRSCVEKSPWLPSSVKFTFEAQRILGSGGGIRFAKEHLEGEGNFFVANGDEVFIPERKQILRNLHDRHLSEKAIATLLVTDNALAGSTYGAVWCDSQMRVWGIGRVAPNSNLKPFHFTGYQILSDEIFRHLPAGENNIFYDVLVNRIGEGHRVMAVKENGLWLGMGK